MTRYTCLSILLAAVISPAMLTAQQPKKKPVTATAKPAAAKYRVCVLPEFYNYKPVKKGDTTYSFESYDRNDNKINIDVLPDIDNAEEIFVLKSYYQSPPKPGAIISPPYLSARVYMFERTSKTTWIGKDLMTKKKTALRADLSKTARKDTVEVRSSETGKMQNIVHKYYKINVVDEASVPPGSHVH